MRYSLDKFPLSPKIQQECAKIIELARQYGATRLVLFGSTLSSLTPRDLDIAVDGVEGWQLYQLGAELEETINLPLDLIPLTPPNRFTQIIEQRGYVLYDSRAT